MISFRGNPNDKFYSPLLSRYKHNKREYGSIKKTMLYSQQLNYQKNLEPAQTFFSSCKLNVSEMVTIICALHESKPDVFPQIWRSSRKYKTCMVGFLASYWNIYESVLSCYKKSKTDKGVLIEGPLFSFSYKKENPKKYNIHYTLSSLPQRQVSEPLSCNDDSNNGIFDTFLEN